MKYELCRFLAKTKSLDGTTYYVNYEGSGLYSVSTNFDEDKTSVIYKNGEEIYS